MHIGLIVMALVMGGSHYSNVLTSSKELRDYVRLLQIHSIVDPLSAMGKTGVYFRCSYCVLQW